VHPWLPSAPNPANAQWTLRPLGGAPISLAQLKGKVVFLNFWSTTCIPCIAEMPGITALYNSLKAEPVAFVAVTQDDEKSVRAFLHEYPIGVPVYLAGRDVPADLTPGGLPTTFILDREGAVVYREIGAANWNDDRVRTFLRNLAGPHGPSG
jgi:thiol-disulfide isomerase/thioredoxin